jgi:tetratricopeptide (TPR) repeat protein
VSSRLFVVNQSFPRRILSFSASPAGQVSVSGICASLGLPCLICFLCLCLLLGPAARAESSPASAQQGPASRKLASAAQTNAGPAVAENAVKPGESLTPDPALAPARLFLQQGMLGEAERAIRNYFEAHADSADAHFLLGFILFREVSAKWLETGEKDSEALRYNSGDLSGSLVAYRDAKVKESLAEFTAGAKYHVPNAFDLKIVALDYILLKDYIDADHWLTRSLQWDPRDAQAWYYLGRTKYSESQFPQAIEAFAQCLKLEPRNIQAENNVGLSYEALGQRDQAIQAFKNAIAWDVQNPAKDPEPFIELAHLYLNQNQPEKAVPYLSESIAIFPRVSKAHETLGKAYSLLHRLPEAQAELEKAVALEPERASLHCMLGQIYRQEGMVPEAKAEFDRCTALQQTQSANPAATE